MLRYYLALLALLAVNAIVWGLPARAAYRVWRARR
jgi:hypothetical protein